MNLSNDFGRIKKAEDFLLRSWRGYVRQSRLANIDFRWSIVDIDDDSNLGGDDD